MAITKSPGVSESESKRGWVSLVVHARFSSMPLTFTW
jgi:hypothetical protein